MHDTYVGMNPNAPSNYRMNPAGGTPAGYPGRYAHRVEVDRVRATGGRSCDGKRPTRSVSSRFEKTCVELVDTP